MTLCAGAAQAAPLDDIRRQVESSQFEQAYQTAQANPQLLGDVHFDFLYGVAAINVGRVAEGLLALERHLAAVPANDRARLELARGYFLLGEYTRARSEFEFVLRYNQPAGVRANIAGFLQAMQARESSDRRASARFYAELGGGYDNNINGGTYNTSYRVGPETIFPDAASRQLGDYVGQVAIGGQHQLRVSNRMSVFIGADLDHRKSERQEIYDLSNGNVYIGFTQLSGVALLRTTLSAGQLLVGHNRYRDTLQLGTEASLSFSPEQSLLVFAQYGQRSHAAADQDRDGRALNVGAMFTQNLPGVWGSPSLGFRAVYAQEDNQKGRKDFSKKGPLLRAFASVSPWQRLRVSAGLTAGLDRYGAADAFYQLQGDPDAVREDKTVSADVVLNYAIDAQWSLRADATWTVTESNQDLYDTRRKALIFKVRYQF
jgi:tetratricopeptide (TPR) repeat protein